MATPKEKKNFADTMAINRPDKDGLDAMFPASDQPQAPAEPAAPKQTRTGKYRGQRTDTNDGRVAVTFKLPADMVDQLRAMAYWDRVEQWQIVADALSAAVEVYKTTHDGKLEPIPTRKQ